MFFRLTSIMILLPAFMSLAGASPSTLRPGFQLLYSPYYLEIEEFGLKFDISCMDAVNFVTIKMAWRVSSRKHQATWTLPCFTTRFEAGTKGGHVHQSILTYGLVFFMYEIVMSFSYHFLCRFFLLGLGFGCWMWNWRTTERNCSIQVKCYYILSTKTEA